jgi:hypothetical protein
MKMTLSVEFGMPGHPDRKGHRQQAAIIPSFFAPERADLLISGM